MTSHFISCKSNCTIYSAEDDSLISPYPDFARRKEAYQHSNTSSGASNSSGKSPVEEGCTFCEIVAGSQPAFTVSRSITTMSRIKLMHYNPGL